MTSVRPRGSSGSGRHGVTLLELLVVLLLLGVTAAVVYPSLPRRAADTDANDDARAMLASARRTAIRRGEPLRLRLDRDGVWALVALRDGAAIQAGRLAARADTPSPATRTEPADGRTNATPVMIVTIDAMGSCVPSGPASTTARFDPLACAWDSPAPSPQP